MANNVKQKRSIEPKTRLQDEQKRYKVGIDCLRVTWKDIVQGKKLELRPLQQPPKDFCNFIEGSSKAELIRFFREVAEEIERRQIQDFHMKIKNRKNSFYIEVLYGDQKEGPEEVPQGACISCFANALLFPGLEPEVKAGDCILKEYSDQPYVQCSVDAKARPGFIITPTRHVERMSELGDEELFALWSVPVRALRNEAVPFISMILNHGTYRNLPHLHLKVWVDNELHKRARLNWTQERIDLWKRLIELNKAGPKKQQLCMAFQRHKWCRYGDTCRYLHVM